VLFLLLCTFLSCFFLNPQNVTLFFMVFALFRTFSRTMPSDTATRDTSRLQMLLRYSVIADDRRSCRST